MATTTQTKSSIPPQHQNQQPGIESQMNPQPEFDNKAYKAAGKLKDKVALITGGDSGIGRAIALAYAKEGADVVLVYLNEHGDAEEAKRHIENAGPQCLQVAGDIGDESFCQQLIQQAVQKFGKLDILVNNAAEQHPQESIEDITSEQLERTFRTNIFSFFYLTKAAIPHLKAGSAIINTASVTAYHGHEKLLDYSATKGAIVTFTRSLSLQLHAKGIRVNAVAPGPIWTPLIPSTFSEQDVAAFGASTPMKRAGQPSELAASYVFLASEDSSYMAGQVLHVNGGTIVNG
ncbi:glucose 1-dehydrogenase [Paenibacillus sp. 5J-6]|uniref:Glucose 1-dehydrogenase n=1 Tax=Paenibacillus silvestris TaxID=2606219 RepID=A0A6L8V9M8_9BACL|nr:SDR family oxidoreductase [Paenibacillus silvestris]MZQ86341.1 glucose 1-dehydrogenase [Paenibacillus silvestris]